MRKVIMNMKAAIMQETLSDVIQLKATSSVGVEMVRKKMEEMDKLRDELIRYVKENHCDKESTGRIYRIVHVSQNAVFM